MLPGTDGSGGWDNWQCLRRKEVAARTGALFGGSGGTNGRCGGGSMGYSIGGMDSNGAYSAAGILGVTPESIMTSGHVDTALANERLNAKDMFALQGQAQSNQLSMFNTYNASQMEINRAAIGLQEDTLGMNKTMMWITALFGGLKAFRIDDIFKDWAGVGATTPVEPDGLLSKDALKGLAADEVMKLISDGVEFEVRRAN